MKTDCAGQFPTGDYDCKAGMCVQSCGKTDENGVELIVDRQVDIYEVQGKIWCKSGQVCVDNQCILSCNANDTKACRRSGQTCQTDGYCGECRSDTDCTRKYPPGVTAVCSAGKCRQPCGEDGNHDICKRRTDEQMPNFECSDKGNLCVSNTFFNFSYLLTQDVRTGDKAVQRDKEMRKIEKCSRFLTILHHIS